MFQRATLCPHTNCADDAKNCPPCQERFSEMKKNANLIEIGVSDIRRVYGTTTGIHSNKP